jgi:small conductance mechanosensitive channel
MASDICYDKISLPQRLLKKQKTALVGKNNEVDFMLYFCLYKKPDTMLEKSFTSRIAMLGSYFLTALVILAATIIVERLITYILTRFIGKAIKKIGAAPTNFVFFSYLVSGFIYICGIIVAIYSIPPLKNVAFSLFAGAGILAAIIGFASQQAISNVISGIFLVISKPFKVGDRVDIGVLYEGYVEDITLRHTVIRNFENRKIIIPNSIINSEYIINSSVDKDMICRHIEFNIAYTSSIDLAMDIIRDEAEKHPETQDQRTPQDIAAGIPKIVVRVIELGEYYVKLRAWVWAVDSPSSFHIYTDMRKTVKERFEREGIEIPIPMRKIIE